MTKAQAELNYKWRISAWESRHRRNFRSPFHYTQTVTGIALNNDPTWTDKLD